MSLNRYSSIIHRFDFKPVAIGIILLGVIAGIFFRFYGLEHLVFWYDEAFTLLYLAGADRGIVIEHLFTGNIIENSQLLAYQIRPTETSIRTLLNILSHDVHTPLYFITLKYWQDLFGISIASARSLSAVLSVLCLPSLYWLSRELFGQNLGHRVGIIGLTLLAISPVQILYAQEARMYSLTVLGVLLINASFIRALRDPKHHHWLLYGGFSIIGLYSHYLMVLVLVSHWIYTLYQSAIAPMPKKRLLYPLFTTTCVSGLSLLPWVWLTFQNRQAVSQVISRGSQLSIRQLIPIWLRNLTQSFVDFGYSEYFFPFILLLCGIAIWQFLKTKPPAHASFVLFTAVVVWLPLMGHDLVLGGSVSTRYRYVLPVVICLQLIVSYWLALCLQSERNKVYRWGQMILASLVVFGLISGGAIAQSNYWWNKGHNRPNVAIAQKVNEAPQALLVSTPHELNVVDLLSLSHLFKPETQFLLFSESSVTKSKIPIKSHSVFLYNPSPQLRKTLSQTYTIQSFAAIPKLFHLEHDSTSAS